MTADGRRRSGRDALVFALDIGSLQAARATATRVAAHVGVVKIGLELYLAHGPAAATIATDLGISLFLDLKLHDIPATVAGAVRSVAGLGARYVTVHASGGRAMLAAAVEAARAAPHPLTIVAVTALTSLGAPDLAALGVPSPPAAWVATLAEVAFEAGVRAFVCSAHEAAQLRARFGAGVCIITPGIRSAGAASDDQVRVTTPASAIALGADLLVVGRPIRDAPDPGAAAASFAAEIDHAILAAAAVG